MRYDRDRVAEAYGRLNMLLEESTTYQWILEKGKNQGLTQGLSQGERNLLLLVGTKKFGPPSPSVRAEIEAIAEPARLERLGERILDAVDWNDLMRSE
jgi:hypothetical protein